VHGGSDTQYSEPCFDEIRKPLLFAQPGLLINDIQLVIVTTTTNLRESSDPAVTRSIPVSLFTGVIGVKKSTKPERIIDLREALSNEDLPALTAELRALKKTDPKAYKSERAKRCPSFIVGHCQSRGKLKSVPQYLLFDIDGGDEGTHVFNLRNAQLSPIISDVFQSLGGGTRIGVWCKGVTAENYKNYYTHIAKELSEGLGIPLKSSLSAAEARQLEHIDDGTSALNQMWFAAYTPSEMAYHNYESKVVYLPEESPAPQEEKDNREGGNGYKYEFSQAEKVENLITQIEQRRLDLTPGKTGNWFKIGCALFDEFGDGAIDYFQRVSRFHPEYNQEETERQFVECRRKHNGRVRINTFYQFCKEAGVNVDYEALKATRPEFRQSSGDQVADIVQTDEDTEEKLPEIDDENLDVIEGCYYWQCNNKGKTLDRLSNFIVRPLYLLCDSQEPKRVWEIIGSEGVTETICFPVRYLSKPTEFSSMIEGKGNFVASWSPKRFARLKEYLYRHEKQAEEISVLGFQPDTNYYAFADAVFDGKKLYRINEYGIAQVRDHRYFLPAFSSVNEGAEREYHNERKFRFCAGTATFEQWTKQFIEVFGDNGKIGVCFVVAALFRDIIFSHVNSFPLLFLFGPKGTGKTTFRQAMKCLFGNYGPADAIGLGSASSPKGFARKLAQIRNGLEAFEEYKNRINPALIEMLKNVYDGIGYERAQTTNDNRTHATLVNSAVVVAGQEMPSKENALFSRVLMLSFGQTKHSEMEKAAFAELERMIGQGLGNVLVRILKERKAIVDGFATSFKEVYKHLRQDPRTNGLDERSLNNVAAILAPFRLLADRLSFPFDYRDAYRITREKILEQHELMNKSSEVSQFWEIVDYLAGNLVIKKDPHYSVKDSSLYIHYNSVYPLYYEHGMKSGINVLDRQSLESYLNMHPSVERQQGKGQWRIRMESGQKRCMRFDLEILNLENLEKGVTGVTEDLN
jgi:hypothetical protein